MSSRVPLSLAGCLRAGFHSSANARSGTSIAKPGFDISVMSTAAATAEEITRASKSNLAFAFVSLGKERRRDITVFYAFCRLIDDIADSNKLSPEEKARQLTVWRQALRAPVPEEPALALEVRRLM